MEPEFDEERIPLLERDEKNDESVYEDSQADTFGRFTGSRVTRHRNALVDKVPVSSSDSRDTYRVGDG